MLNLRLLSQIAITLIEWASVRNTEAVQKRASRKLARSVMMSRLRGSDSRLLLVDGRAGSIETASRLTEEKDRGDFGVSGSPERNVFSYNNRTMDRAMGPFSPF